MADNINMSQQMEEFLANSQPIENIDFSMIKESYNGEEISDPSLEYEFESEGSFEEVPSFEIPEIGQILHFQDTYSLKSFVKNNKLDASWYVMLNIHEIGAVRTDTRPEKSKPHPCFLINVNPVNAN